MIIVLADLGFLRGQVDFIHSIPFGDKIGHFLLIGIFTFLIVSSVLKSGIEWNPRTAVFFTILLLAVFFSLEEASQIMFPGRHAGWDDLLANYTGIVVFSLLAWYINKKRTS